MHFDVLGPASGPNVTFYITFVRAGGRGAASDPERLEEALSVALPGKDITMDLREVEELGPNGIAALARTSDMVRSGESGLLYLFATAGESVMEELESSDLADVARHPRVYIVDPSPERR